MVNRSAPQDERRAKLREVRATATWFWWSGDWQPLPCLIVQGSSVHPMLVLVKRGCLWSSGWWFRCSHCIGRHVYCDLDSWLFIHNLHVTREYGCMTNKDKPSCSLDMYLLSLIVPGHPTSWWFTSLVYERCGVWSTPLLSARLGEHWPLAFHQIWIILFHQ